MSFREKIRKGEEKKEERGKEKKETGRKRNENGRKSKVLGTHRYSARLTSFNSRYYVLSIFIEYIQCFNFESFEVQFVN